MSILLLYIQRKHTMTKGCQFQRIKSFNDTPVFTCHVYIHFQDWHHFSLFFTQSVYNSMISKDLHDLGLSTYIFIFLKIYTYTNRKMYGLIFTVLFYWKYLENEQINDIYWPVLSLDSYFTKRRKSCRFGTTWVWAKNISFWILPLNIIFLNNVNLLKQEKQFSTEHFCFTWSLSITLSFLHSDVLFKYLRQFQWLEMEPKYYIVNKMNNKHI